MKRYSLTKILIVLGAFAVPAIIGLGSSKPAFCSKDDHVVVDPKTKQRVLVNELVIFGEGKVVASIVAEYDGVITIAVPETDTYQARFRVKSLKELDTVARKLRGRGLKVQYALVRKPPAPSNPQ